MAEIITLPKTASVNAFSVPTHLAKWESEANSFVSRAIEYNLTKAQRSFRYPDFLLLPLEHRDNPSSLIGDVLFRASQVGTKVFSDSHEVFKHFLETLPTRPKIGYMGSLLGSQFHPNILWKKFERDPEYWNEFDLKGLDAFVLSNPHGNDGFYFPQEFYLKLYQSLRFSAPGLHIYSEESLNAAVLNDTEAGSLKSFLPMDKNLWVEDSVYPVLTPAGPQAAWLHHQSFSKLQDTDSLSDNEKEITARALLCFEQQNSPSFFEYKRRKMGVAYSVKVLSLYLNQALTSGTISIPHWPDAGFHILVNIQALLQIHGFKSAKEWCLHVAEKYQILVNPGDLIQEKNCIQICFAASGPYLDKLGPLLREALSATPKDTELSP